VLRFLHCKFGVATRNRFKGRTQRVKRPIYTVAGLNVSASGMACRTALWTAPEKDVATASGLGQYSHTTSIQPPPVSRREGYVRHQASW
jgi:hypothetical protein